MAPLKENIHGLLKKHHLGKSNQITIHDLCRELFPIRITLSEIRQAVRELWFEDIPIVYTSESPPCLYFAETDEEKKIWAEAKIDLLEWMHERKMALERLLNMRPYRRMVS